MSFETVLYEHAISTIWDRPSVDNHAVFKTVRLTKKTGAQRTVKLNWGDIELPRIGVTPDTINAPYVLYELGGHNVLSLGINTNISDWVRLDTFIQSSNTTTNVLVMPFINGRVLNMKTCYIKQLHEGTIVIAVNYRLNVKVVDPITKGELFIKFYNNIGFIDDNSIGMGYLNHIYMETLTTAYNNFVAEVNAFVGTPLVYLNGFWMPDGIPSNLVTGDIIQVILDPFITKSEGNTLAGMLPTFPSELDDGMIKRTLSSTVEQNVYIDDCDIYVTGVYEDRRIGGYLSRDKISDIRMLTYIDWAISEEATTRLLKGIVAFRDINTENLLEPKVHIVTRRNTFVRRRVNDTNRINDLMNLSVGDRKNAMAVDAPIPIWRAPALEQSKFSAFASSPYAKLNMEKFSEVLTYQGAISVLESTYKDFTDGTYHLPLLAGSGKLLTFDDAGFFEDISTVVTDEFIGNGTEHWLPDNSAEQLTIVVASSSVQLNTSITPDVKVLAYYFDVVQTKFVTLTRDLDYFVSPLGTVTWTDTLLPYVKFLRVADRRVEWDRVITTNELITGFSVYNSETLDAGHRAVGMGQLYIWRNNRYLIEGLDYHVKEGNVHLVSTFKTEGYGDLGIIDTETNQITPGSEGAIIPTHIRVIYCGIPDVSLKHVPKGDWGWVLNDRISANNNYDLYTERNNWVFVDGKAVKVSNDNTDEGYGHTSNQNGTDIKAMVNVSGTVGVNGSPWCIVPKYSYTDPFALASLVTNPYIDDMIDTTIESYLNDVIDLPDPDIVVIESGDNYNLVSPVMAAVLQDFRDGVLTIPYGNVGDIYFTTVMHDYMHLLEVDPATKDHNPAFTEIHHSYDNTLTTVNMNEYNFLQEINARLLNGKVTGFSNLIIGA